MEPEKLHRPQPAEDAKHAPASRSDEAADRAAAERLSSAQMAEMRGVEVREVFVGFGLEAGKVLAKSGSVDVTTKYASRVTVLVRPGAVELRASPFIFLDATWPAANMNFYGVTYDLRSKTAHAQVETGDGHGFLDYTSDARSEIEGMISGLMAGTRFADKGYDPMQDPDVMGTIGQFAQKVKSLPSKGGGGGAGVGAADLRSLSGGGTIAVKKGVHVDADGGGVDIPAGGQLTIDIQGSGSVGEVAGAQGPQAMANAFQATGIDVTSDAVTLLHKGKPVAKLHELHISRGGQVRVGRFTLEGSAATAAGVESLLRLIGGALDAHSRGAPDGLAWEIGARGAEPTLVAGLTRDALEKALSTAARRLIVENSGVIPGIDLAQALGVK